MKPRTAAIIIALIVLISGGGVFYIVWNGTPHSSAPSDEQSLSPSPSSGDLSGLEQPSGSPAVSPTDSPSPSGSSDPGDDDYNPNNPFLTRDYQNPFSASYAPDSPWNPSTVSLTAGFYALPKDPSITGDLSPETKIISILSPSGAPMVAFGDLDGDGKDDATVVLFQSTKTDSATYYATRPRFFKGDGKGGYVVAPWDSQMTVSSRVLEQTTNIAYCARPTNVSSTGGIVQLSWSGQDCTPRSPERYKVIEGKALVLLGQVGSAPATIPDAQFVEHADLAHLLSFKTAGDLEEVEDGTFDVTGKSNTVIKYNFALAAPIPRSLGDCILSISRSAPTLVPVPQEITDWGANQRITFYVASSQDGAAGSVGLFDTYVIEKNGTCYTARVAGYGPNPNRADTQPERDQASLVFEQAKKTMAAIMRDVLATVGISD